MIKINTDKIEEAVYNLCISANTIYDNNLYQKLFEKYETETDKKAQSKLKNILDNIELAKKRNRPLCQDTGQVIVFIEIGQSVVLDGINLNVAINKAIREAYENNYYRKSVVKNAIFDRTNTSTNTPAIIYTEIIDKPEINIKVLIKGAGSENYSTTKMLTPAANSNDIYEFIKQSVITAGEKSCPPLVLGIGIGGTMDTAAVLSKKAFFNEVNTKEEEKFIKGLRTYLKDINKNILDIKIMTTSTHIASLPCALTINCHSTRHSSCTITEKGITYKIQNTEYKKTLQNDFKAIKIHTDEKEKIKNLKKGQIILLNGKIYTARDAAHKKIVDYYKKYKKLPFDVNGKIIFYAGPCPAAPDEVLGPIGPTTSTRMDSYCELLYSKGLLATIGKGERTENANKFIKQYKGKYFCAQGGIACLLANCIKESKVIAFEELGTESVRELTVENFPLEVYI